MADKDESKKGTQSRPSREEIRKSREGFQRRDRRHVGEEVLSVMQDKSSPYKQEKQVPNEERPSEHKDSSTDE